MVEHAVILGGGIAGLAVAAALADGTRAVTLVERDHYPDEPAPRSGTPQSRHVHTLLLRGSAELEELVPGAAATLVARGALRLDWGRQRLFGAYGWSPRIDTGLLGVSCSRGLVERLLTEHVLSRPGVTLLDKHEVTGLLGGSEGVRGALVRSRGTGPTAAIPGQAPRERGAGKAADGMPLEADLVIDATGRGSMAPQWLAGLAVQPPAEQAVSSGIGYVSRAFRRPEDTGDGWGLLNVRQPPPSTRTGVLYPVEGNRWMVTLTGIGADAPPHDEAGFAAFAAALPGGVGEALRDAEPLGRIAAYRATASRRRRWERRHRLPRGLLVVGDASCCFNPIYGQGMAVALAQARLLRDSARSGRLTHATVATVQRAFAAVASDPWTMATQEDFRYPTTEGRRPPGSGLTLRYADRVLAATARDPVVFTRFLEVAHLLRPHRSLLYPDTARRVMLASRFR